MNYTLRPCKCGRTPALIVETRKRPYTARVVCECGEKGGLLRFLKLEVRPLAEEAAIDGWNLGE